MPTIGVDCMIILDGTGYWIEPGSYLVSRPRVFHAQLTRAPASGGQGVTERVVDFGPQKREFSFIVVAFQAIKDYSGNFVTSTGQAYRDALTASYEKVSTVLSFVDPHNVTWNVRFDQLSEELADIRAQPDAELQ